MSEASANPRIDRYKKAIFGTIGDMSPSRREVLAGLVTLPFAKPLLEPAADVVVSAALPVTPAVEIPVAVAAPLAGGGFSQFVVVSCSAAFWPPGGWASR